MTITSTKTKTGMPIRNILFANAGFSLLAGLVLMAASSPWAGWFGVSRWVLVGVGAALLPWAAFVFRNARREPPLRRDTLLTIAGDLGWVVAAAAIIVLPDTLTVEGQWALGIVSLAVFDFAVFQWLALRRGW